MRHLELRPGLYRDSVRLMQISGALTHAPGVHHALVAMATELNLDLLTDLGIVRPEAASPNDLLVAIVVDDDDSLAVALELLERELAGPGAATGMSVAGLTGGGIGGTPVGVGTGQIAPRTTASAARLLSGPGLALVSTPGRYAFVEAVDAMDAGLSVMIFSDNVPVDQEVLLKQTAAERGLLVMGPDCGTSIVGGVGLGFANVVRPGPVGVVAASGTGAQQLMSLLAVPGGAGISHCLGAGGRDMSEQVGGRTTHAALDLLDADESTGLIVVLGKPPAPRVAAGIRAHAAALATPVIVAPLGAGETDLTAVTEQVLARLGVAAPRWPAWTPSGARAATGGWVRGLFSGGTLCVEAMMLTVSSLGPVRSNVPLRPEWRAGTGTDGHVMLDLGADEYTRGRPHPMIDFGPRCALLEREAADPRVGVLLLDVVLGHGAHPDPAAELVPVIQTALARRPTDLTVVVSLIGTPDDPQGLTHQAEALCAAGAWVHLSNAEAARRAAEVARRAAEATLGAASPAHEAVTRPHAGSDRTAGDR